MSLNLINLDSATRNNMIAEVDCDIEKNILYLSPRLNPKGIANYPTILKDAITNHDDTWLSSQLSGLMNATEERKKPKGGFTIVSAPETLAEGEFNRFYARGLCLRAIEEKVEYLIIYRAKVVTNPRPESQAKIGTHINPQALLADLRKNIGVETALGLPPGPNSGLSVKLP